MGHYNSFQQARLPKLCVNAQASTPSPVLLSTSSHSTDRESRVPVLERASAHRNFRHIPSSTGICTLQTLQVESSMQKKAVISFISFILKGPGLGKFCFSQCYSKILVFCDSFLKMTEQKSLFPKLEVCSLPSWRRGGRAASEGFFHLSTFKAGSTLRETSRTGFYHFRNERYLPSRQ